MAFRPFFGNLVEPGGDPASGAKIYVYLKNTTTPTPMYTNISGATPATNPIIADADGRFRVYFNDATNYSIRAKTSDDATTILEADITAGVLSIELVFGQIWHADWSQPLAEPLSWTDIASAATVDLGAAGANNIRITGTTTITAFGTAMDGLERTVRFAGALTLTHNATSLILPGAANITTAAGDTAIVKSLGGGNWVCLMYQPAEGYQRYDADLLAYAGLSTTGMVSRTGAGSAATRSITGTANEITSTNGDGVAGAPTLSLPSALTFTGKTITGGTFIPAAVHFTNAQGVQDGGLFRQRSIATTTAIQGYSAGAIVLEANTAAGGDLSTVRELMRITYHNPTDAPGALSTGAVVDDNDFYVYATNIGINSRNTQTYPVDTGGAPYDTGPVLTMSRDVAAPPVNSLMASLDFAGRDSTSGFVNTRYAFLAGYVKDPTAGSTDGGLIIATTLNGAENTNFRVEGGVYLVGSTDPGQGNLLATSVFCGQVDTRTTSALNLRTNNGAIQCKFGHQDTTAEWITIKGATSGGRPNISTSDSTAAAVGLDLITKSSGTHRFYTNTGADLQLEITHTGSATRNVTITGSNGGNPSLGASAGSLAVSSTLAPAGLLDISGASAGQIKFPASQNASADANTLDDYEEGTFTPALTAATPGDLSITYSTQIGRYTKIGNTVHISIDLESSAFTHTTASGSWRVTGLPFTSANVSNQHHVMATGYSGITKASYTSFYGRIFSNSTIVLLVASGSGVAEATVDAADMPTGGSIVLHITSHYST